MTQFIDLPSSPIKLSDMRRHWWITYQWETIQEFGEPEPLYVCGGYRPIEQVEEAARQFDEMWQNRRACAIDKEHES